MQHLAVLRKRERLLAASYGHELRSLRPQGTARRFVADVDHFDGCSPLGAADDVSAYGVASVGRRFCGAARGEPVGRGQGRIGNLKLLEKRFVIAGQGPFLRAGPSFELTFATFSLRPSEEGFDVDDSFGRSSLSKSCPAAFMLAPAAKKIGSQPDVRPDTPAFENIHEPCFDSRFDSALRQTQASALRQAQSSAQHSLSIHRLAFP